MMMLRGRSTGDYVLLASRDPAQPAEEVVRYCYHLRYQLELRIRDGEQHRGLHPYQAQDQ